MLPGRLEYRDAARVFLGYLCERLTARGILTADVAHQVISAFVEAFNNAVIHAYRDMEPGTVEVEMDVWPTSLEVRITDRGKTFDPARVPEPDLDALPEGGLGLFIIKNFMDRVGYARHGDANVLTMAKDLRATAAVAPRE